MFVNKKMEFTTKALRSPRWDFHRFAKSSGLLRTDRHYLGLAFYKFQIVPAQLLPMPAAAGSSKSTVEDKDDMPV